MMRAAETTKARRQVTKPERCHLFILHSSGITLIELLVSLSILVILFGLLFLPMLTGINLFHQGKARAETQDVVRHAMEQMQREMSQAMFVYTNTDYINTSDPTNPLTVLSRIDFVLPQKDSSGELITPLQPSDKFISYYVRLADPTKPSDVEDSDGDGIRDALKASAGAHPNLHVLYRAEYKPLPAPNDLAWRTYPNASSVDETFDLSSNSKTDPTNRSHTSMTPLEDTDVVSVSFQLKDAVNDQNKVGESVIVSLKVARFDVARGGGVASQLTQEIYLPNAKRLQ